MSVAILGRSQFAVFDPQQRAGRVSVDEKPMQLQFRTLTLHCLPEAREMMECCKLEVRWA